MDNNMIELRFPATKDMLLVARMTTTGVLARANFTLDDMDDVKLAVEEALNCLLMSSGSIYTLFLRFDRKDGMLTIHAGVESGEDIAPIDFSEREVMRCILESMMDEVRLCGPENSIRDIYMAKRLGKTGDRV